MQTFKAYLHSSPVLHTDLTTQTHRECRKKSGQDEDSVAKMQKKIKSLTKCKM